MCYLGLIILINNNSFSLSVSDLPRSTWRCCCYSREVDSKERRLRAHGLPDWLRLVRECNPAIPPEGANIAQANDSRLYDAFDLCRWRKRQIGCWQKVCFVVWSVAKYYTLCNNVLRCHYSFFIWHFYLQCNGSWW